MVQGLDVSRSQIIIVVDDGVGSIAWTGAFHIPLGRCIAKGLCCPACEKAPIDSEQSCTWSKDETTGFQLSPASPDQVPSRERHTLPQLYLQQARQDQLGKLQRY